jgi:hypothetical protein
METIEFNTAALDGFVAIMGYAEQQMGRYPAREPRPAGVSQPLINSIRKRLIDLDPVLYEGNWEHSGRYPSQSEADLALCGRIAGICKKSNLSAEEAESVIKEIFRQSGLFRQVKWKTIQTHTIPKALSTYRTVRSNDEDTECQNNERPPEKVWTKDNLFADMTLKESDVKLMMDAKFLVPNMIVQGHLGAYVAPGNAGKTTIFTYLCEKLASQGVDVQYINVDGSPSDLKRHYEHAARHGYKVISPDATDGGFSYTDVIKRFQMSVKESVDLSGTVFILDTLKKFIDVIDKKQSKELYKLLRSLTVKCGATVCLLGHVNKHPGKDGNTIFEGTGDLRNDLDELIYLDSFKNHQNNTLEVHTRPDKVRADFKSRAFTINLKDRSVSEADDSLRYVPEVDRKILDLVVAAIFEGKHHTQKAITEFVKERSSHGDKKIHKVLATYGYEAYRITIKRQGRAKDYFITLTNEERKLQEEALRKMENSPF